MIISKTPFRISFIGGGTDIKDFYSFEPGAVVSTCLDKYMYICVNKRFDHTIRVSYSKTEIVENVKEILHPIAREALKLTGIKGGIEIVSIADIPTGTGLGSSGSFTVGLLNALYAYKGKCVTVEKLAQEACRIEIDILAEPIGKQDQFIVAYGGLQYIRFNSDESVTVEPIKCSNKIKSELNDNLLMFYTGVTRKSSIVLHNQKKNAEQNMGYLREMKSLSSTAKTILTQGKNCKDFGKILHDGWLLKKKLADMITNERIDKYYQMALESGALGGKLLGAGSGGFLLIYVEKHNQQKVRKALKELSELHFSFEQEGTKIIYAS
ncbi:GHMP kinase [Candidatus Omnitrophota bacterium]